MSLGEDHGDDVGPEFDGAARPGLETEFDVEVDLEMEQRDITGMDAELVR